MWSLLFVTIIYYFGHDKLALIVLKKMEVFYVQKIHDNSTALLLGFKKNEKRE